MPGGKEQNRQYIICPVCESTGENKYKMTCKNCGGLGLGTFYHNHFFYWNKKLSVVLIELEKIRKKVNSFINFFAFFIGLSGFLILGWWYYNETLVETTNIFTKFLEHNDLKLFYFWCTLFADMFVIYRMSEEKRKSQKIKPIKYEERNKAKKVPNNWSELKTSNGKMKIDISKGMSYGTSKIVNEAYMLAHNLQHKKMDVLHLFYVLLKENQVVTMFARLNVNPEILISKIKRQLEKKEKNDEPTIVSIEVKEALVNAYLDAYDFDLPFIEPMNLVLPAVKYDKLLEEILYDNEVDKNKLYNLMKWFIIDRILVENYKEYKKMARFKPATNMDRAYTSVATPILNQFAYDLTIAAKWNKLDMCISREKEIESIFQSIESGQNGIILTGDVGVGKKTIVDGIAQLMVKEDVPKVWQDKRLVEIDVAALAGGSNAAESQGRLASAINEVMRAGNIILFVSNLENVMGITSGAEESLELSEVLANAVERGMIYCIATATNQNYTKYIEGKPLGNVMTRIEVDEPKGNMAIQIIESKISAFEGKYKVFFSYNAIENVIKMSEKYIHDKHLPEVAIKILNKVAVKVSKEKGENSIVTKEDISAIVSDITKIPVSKISEDESENLLQMEDLIHERMVDQVEAVSMVSASLRRARAQLREGNRPIANFLFLGPTGVGKTELAKTVSEIYFGKEEYMIRVDMSEYQHPASIEKLIGSHYGTQGYLTEKVRRSPFSLVLLDELEKAHPDILNVFLQVMDDGRLTDGQGRTIDFTNSIIIATSNAGALYIQKEIMSGSKVEDIKDTLVNEHLVKVMRPELVNRFDGVIVFKPLSIEDVEKITNLMLKKTAKLLEEQGIGLKVEEDGIKILARHGYDPKFGARPLRRLLQNKIDNVIANKILSKELTRRDLVVIDSHAEVKVVKAVEL